MDFGDVTPLFYLLSWFSNDHVSAVASRNGPSHQKKIVLLLYANNLEILGRNTGISHMTGSTHPGINAAGESRGPD